MRSNDIPVIGFVRKAEILGKPTALYTLTLISIRFSK